MLFWHGLEGYILSMIGYEESGYGLKIRKCSTALKAGCIVGYVVRVSPLHFYRQQNPDHFCHLNVRTLMPDARVVVRKKMTAG